jgi:predicted PurR-regulated permease PerM
MRRPVLYAFVFLGVYLSYRVLSPFFVALTWAVLLAILFRGMQTALARRTGPNSAALITTLVVGVLIVGPAGGLISALAQEAPQAIRSSDCGTRFEHGVQSRCPRIRPSS